MIVDSLAALNKGTGTLVCGPQFTAARKNLENLHV